MAPSLATRLHYVRVRRAGRTCWCLTVGSQGREPQYDAGFARSVTSPPPRARVPKATTDRTHRCRARQV